MIELGVILALIVGAVFSRSVKASEAPDYLTRPESPPVPKSTIIGGKDAGIFADAIRTAAQVHGVPADLLSRLLWTESRFKPDAYNKSSGAAGIAQFMPETAKEYGVNVYDPYSSIDGAARYLKWLYGYLGNDWTKAVAGYNWGPGNVKRKGLAGVRKIPETVAYVESILGITV